MKITTSLTKTYTYHFHGVKEYLHEIKGRILEQVTSVLECQVDSNIDIDMVGTKYVINISTPVEIPFMTLSDITNLIPRWHEEFENKEKQDLEFDKEYYRSWKEDTVLRKAKPTDPKYIVEFIRNIGAVYSDAVRCAKQGDWHGAALNVHDYKDLIDILEDIEGGDYKQAYKDYRALDTAVREYVPTELVNRLCPK